MAVSIRYFNPVSETKNGYNHRLRLVGSAKQRVIKPTARLFATTVPAVLKWPPPPVATWPFRPSQAA